MRLLVTGTRNGRPDLSRWLDRWLARHGCPEVAILGDAPGVDLMARVWCVKRSVTFLRVSVDPRLPSPARYHRRNEQMVAHAEPGDHCLAFPDAESRGTWHTVGLARAKGLTVYVLPLLAE